MVDSKQSPWLQTALGFVFLVLALALVWFLEEAGFAALSELEPQVVRADGTPLACCRELYSCAGTLNDSKFLAELIAQTLSHRCAFFLVFGKQGQSPPQSLFYLP